jgi:hypothetical protein
MKLLARSRLALLGVFAALALVLAVSASGQTRHDRDGDDHGGKHLFALRLAGSIPADPAIHTKAPGGVPWDLRRGETSLTSKGRFRLVVRGLVITGTDNPGPVKTITAALYCASDSNAAPAFTAGPVPLSSRGDARIDQKVTVPARCLAPVVLVHPNGSTTRYIAATGWQL